MVAVGSGVAVAVGSGIAVDVGSGVAVAVGSGIAVDVGSSVAVAVGSGIAVDVGSGVAVAVGSGIAVDVGSSVGSWESVLVGFVNFSGMTVKSVGTVVPDTVNSVSFDSKLLVVWLTLDSGDLTSGLVELQANKNSKEKPIKKGRNCLIPNTSFIKLTIGVPVIINPVPSSNSYH